MITALIFDLDGTLADTEALHHIAWEKTLLEHGIEEFPFDVFARYIGTSNEKVAEDYIEIIQKNYTLSTKELIKRKQNNYLELLPQVQLYEKTQKILQYCHTKYPLALATSSHQKEANKILESHGIHHLFKKIVCGDMVTRRKPDPEIYLLAAKELNIDPQKCAAVEDTEFGTLAAKKAGMFTIAIPNVHTKHHNFKHADRILNSISDLKEVL